MKHKRRLDKIEQALVPNDDLVAQVKRVWLVFGETLTDEQAEQVAQSYRDRGYDRITWANTMRVNSDDIKGFE